MLKCLDIQLSIVPMALSSCRDFPAPKLCRKVSWNFFGVTVFWISVQTRLSPRAMPHHRHQRTHNIFYFFSSISCFVQLFSPPRSHIFFSIRYGPAAFHHYKFAYTFSSYETANSDDYSSVTYFFFVYFALPTKICIIFHISFIIKFNLNMFCVADSGLTPKRPLPTFLFSQNKTTRDRRGQVGGSGTRRGWIGMGAWPNILGGRETIWYEIMGQALIRPNFEIEKYAFSLNNSFVFFLVHRMCVPVFVRTGNEGWAQITNWKEPRRKNRAQDGGHIL